MGTSWNDDGEFALPANMTEDEVLEIVRELIGDDEMTKEELREAYRSGVFQELCPDVAQYAKNRLGPGNDGEGSTPKDDTPKVKIKEERPDSALIKRERERTPEKKKEPKPFSKYNETVSYTNLNRWKPVLHRDHFRYQRRFRLKPVSVVCVDLMDLPLVFYSPYRRPTNPHAVPLNAHLTVSSSRRALIRRLERDKISTFRKKLNRKAAKIMKLYKYKKIKKISGEGNRKNKRNRIMDRIASSASSSDISSIGIPRKRSKMDDDFKGRSGGKMSKSAREAEARRKKIEEVKRKADKLSARGTRKLPWENKDEYFTSSKKKDAKKEKERLQAIEKKKKLEKIKEKLTNSPSMKFQKILAQIDAANKAEASKPTVQLKIPKISDGRSRAGADYKLEGKIGIGEVASEVTRLLSSNVKVECPVMPESVEDFGEYTVKKISWWLLKNEKDPPEFGVWHPELHDDEGMESSHEGDFDWPSDMSSVNGCVSDPEGLTSDMPPDRQKVNDPDWADDYCGLASLYAKIRKKDLMDKLHEKNPSQRRNYETMEPFRTFMRVKPGTNYEKQTFEAKCFICAQEEANVKGRDTALVRGQRQLGAHIRSESHKNNFRNFSLNLVTYEEKVEPPSPRKVFEAQLVEYSVNAVANSQPVKSNLEEDARHHIGKLEPVRSDSPRPLIGGEASTGAIQVHAMPLPDEISLPSIEDYDISSDESLMQVKAAIRTIGKWHDTLETNWRKWIDEETKIATQYNIEREYYITEPARHPQYQEEWLKFWDKRCLELEAEGLDTQNYDFQKEWMPFWLRRVQEIVQEKYEGQVNMLKNKLGIDKHTLRSKFGISAEQTKRSKIKRKKKKVYEPGSSVKSSSKVVSGMEWIREWTTH